MECSAPDVSSVWVSGAAAVPVSSKFQVASKERRIDLGAASRMWVPNPESVLSHRDVERAKFSVVAPDCAFQPRYPLDSRRARWHQDCEVLRVRMILSLAQCR